MNNTNVIEKQERGHHPFSPSKLQNLEACPHYESRQGAHKAALDGTKQHSVTETGSDDHTLDDDQAAAAAECMDFYARQVDLLNEARQRAVLALTANYHARGITDNPEDEVPMITELVEVKLPVDEDRCIAPVWDSATRKMILQELDCTSSGYVDRGLIDHTRTRGFLMDWKFGKWPVEGVENNLQALAYTVGMFRAYPSLGSVNFTFKQPVLQIVDSFTFYRTDLDSILLRIKTIVARKIKANRANMQNPLDFEAATPMVPVCNFCDRLGDCPKVAAAYLKVAQKFYPLEVPENITPSIMHSTLETSKAMRLASVAGAWADAYKRQVTNRVIEGRADMPPGYRFQTKQDRELADKTKFREVALRHIKQEELDAVAEYGFGALEEIIKDKAPRGMKKTSVDAFKAELEAEGAVKKGEPYTFLCAIPDRKGKTETAGE